jgi:hypothetical protein
MGIETFPSQGEVGANRQPKRYDLLIYRGDTLDEIFAFKDGAGTGVNLAGFTALVEFKNLTDSAVVATPTMTVNYTGNGNVRMYMQDTTPIPAGQYRWDLQLTDASSNRRTYIGGLVTVTGDVSD